jgi:hypothetical protein
LGSTALALGSPAEHSLGQVMYCSLGPLVVSIILHALSITSITRYIIRHGSLPMSIPLDDRPAFLIILGRLSRQGCDEPHRDVLVGTTTTSLAFLAQDVI